MYYYFRFIVPCQINIQVFHLENGLKNKKYDHIIKDKNYIAILLIFIQLYKTFVTKVINYSY